MKISRMLKAVDKFNETLKEAGSTSIINIEVDMRAGRVQQVSVVGLPEQRKGVEAQQFIVDELDTWQRALIEKQANTPEKRASRAENSPEDFSSSVDGQAGPAFTEAVQAASKRREGLQISQPLKGSWATASAAQIIEDIQQVQAPAICPPVAHHGRSNRSILIGAGGLKGAGKDALSDHLVDYHDFVKLGMSDTLAKALLILNPWIKVTAKDMDGNNELVFALNVQEWGRGFHRYADLEAALGYTLAKTIEEVRVSLQRLGTDVGRALISDTVWVDISRRLIKEHLAAGRSVIITGMRFHNELVMIEELGGHTVWVNRPSKASAGENVLTEPEALKASQSSAQHASEATLGTDDFSHHVYNGGTLVELYRAGDNLVATLSQDKPPAYNSVEADIIWPSYDH